MEYGDHQLNVLVIDDDPGIRSLLVDIVTRKEHQPVPVESAEEGLELLPFWTFQVAFLDQNLPGMEGLILGEYLRRNNPDMTIVLITGEPSQQLERRTRDLSIRFLPKPFNISHISEILDDYIENAANREQSRIHREDLDFSPPIALYAEELRGYFDMPNIPNRIEELLVNGIKRGLNELKSVNRYSERDRIAVLSGLLAAKVLGINLPKTSRGTSLYEEYDELMKSNGRRKEFEQG